ncbi:YutD family protein [Agrilactobacillus yilanensis]|uniref:YutD family protein n=1 Tax=Agrilactobacillus yilanensis TaxID=2485997 RepID=A0ABW4J6Y1_9LACO|nr:YutD family protein [Agrilactobacillus yilanensis]
MSKNPQIKDETTEKINELLDEAISTPEPVRYVRIVDGQLMINGVDYEVVKDHKEAFDVDKLNDCYSDILNKYDYIVGDWGYDQLRLRGFYRDNNHQANRDQLISTFEDYLYEYCNFGCAYFILKRTGAPYKPKETGHKNTKRKNRSRRRSAPRRNSNQGTNNTKKTNSNSNNKNNHKTNNQEQRKQQKFTVRRLDETK